MIVVRICGVDLPVPVKRIPKRLQLFLKVLHIVLRHNFGMDMVFDRIIFRGKAESIPSHGIQHIISFHPPLARHNVKGRVRAGMSHMKPLPGRIREFHQRIIFGLGIILRGGKSLVFLPDLLPLSFNFFGVIHSFHLNRFLLPVWECLHHRPFFPKDPPVSGDLKWFTLPPFPMT